MAWQDFIYTAKIRVMYTKRLILLNTPLAFPYFVTKTIEIDIDNARDIVKTAKEAGAVIENYVGHPATVTLINKLFNLDLQPSRAMFQPEKEYVALVFRLRKRLAKPSDVENVTENDIQILLIQADKW